MQTTKCYLLAFVHHVLIAEEENFFITLFLKKIIPEFPFLGNTMHLTVVSAVHVHSAWDIPKELNKRTQLVNRAKRTIR